MVCGVYLLCVGFWWLCCVFLFLVWGCVCVLLCFFVFDWAFVLLSGWWVVFFWVFVCFIGFILVACQYFLCLFLWDLCFLFCVYRVCGFV